MKFADHSPAEKCDCWYQADEMLAIRREVKETVALMNQNLPVGIPKALMSTHGLEGKPRWGNTTAKRFVWRLWSEIDFSQAGLGRATSVLEQQPSP